MAASCRFSLFTLSSQRREPRRLLRVLSKNIKKQLKTSYQQLETLTSWEMVYNTVSTGGISSIQDIVNIFFVTTRADKEVLWYPLDIISRKRTYVLRTRYALHVSYALPLTSLVKNNYQQIKNNYQLLPHETTIYSKWGVGDGVWRVSAK